MLKALALKLLVWVGCSKTSSAGVGLGGLAEGDTEGLGAVDTVVVGLGTGEGLGLGGAMLGRSTVGLGRGGDGLGRSEGLGLGETLGLPLALGSLAAGSPLT